MIRTLAGLQRACGAQKNRMDRLYSRHYILTPALERHLARFDELGRISDPAARFEEFRRIPALEYYLEAVHTDLGPERRKSFAQQARARHPRVRLTEGGDTLEAIIRGLLQESAKTGWLRFYEPGEEPAAFSQIVQSWDTANKSTELSDYSVCTTWGVGYRKYYLLDVFRQKLNYPDLKRAILKQAKRYGAPRI